ncbi:MAG: low temperature requirement protein A, partial [Gaiellaceae bacterium]
MFRLRRATGEQERRASFVELFFDLVFVFFVTQLSAFLLADLTVDGVGKTLLLLLIAWWAWLYTTWMTNWWDPDEIPIRILLVFGMLASLLGGIAVPDAFGERAMLFVVGYVGLQVTRNTFFVLGTDRSDPLFRPTARIAAWTGWVSLVWVAGALLGGDERIAVWVSALALDYAGPYVGHWTPGLGRSTPREWHLDHAHFTERIALFMIIALGESIVVTGATASQFELTPARVAALVVALLITAALWWLYFDYHVRRLEGELAAAGENRSRLGRDLGYLHVPLVAGIIVTAVANEIVIAGPGEELQRGELLALGCGPALYLLGSVGFKLRAIHVFAWQRVAGAALVVAAALLGTVASALAAWLLVLAALVALVVFETLQRLTGA